MDKVVGLKLDDLIGKDLYIYEDFGAWLDDLRSGVSVAKTLLEAGHDYIRDLGRAHRLSTAFKETIRCLYPPFGILLFELEVCKTQKWSRKRQMVDFREIK